MKPTRVLKLAHPEGLAVSDAYSGGVIYRVKVLCVFCLRICTPIGRGKGGSANFKTKRTETLNHEIIPPLHSDLHELFIILFRYYRHPLQQNYSHICTPLGDDEANVIYNDRNE